MNYELKIHKVQNFIFALNFWCDLFQLEYNFQVLHITWLYEPVLTFSLNISDLPMEIDQAKGLVAGTAYYDAVLS